jgi:N-terminal domain of toast_rack, DUF2154
MVALGVMTRVVAGAGVAVVLSGCDIVPIATGETRRENVHIDLDTSEPAGVDLHMGTGELTITGGTSKLMEGAFSYNVREWKPVVNYRAGQLRISQPDGMRGGFGNTVYKWDLKLNNGVPLDVSAKLGAGEASFELGGMNLRTVDVSIGAGKATMDLRGAPKRDYSVRIRGGVGEATVYLPKDAAISAKAAGAIGDISVEGLVERDGAWVNPDRPDGPVTVRLDVKGGIGQIKLIR